MPSLKAKPQLTPVQLNSKRAIEELNHYLKMLATEEKTTIKYLILDSLRKNFPELSNIIRAELKVSKK